MHGQKITIEQFTELMEHIYSRYDKKYFTNKTTQLIFEEIKVLTYAQFEEVVNRILSSRRFNPLVKDFSEEVGKIREELWWQQKEINKNENQRHLKTMNHDQFMAGFKAVLKMVNANDFSKMKDVEKFINKISKAKCRECGDSGMIHALDDKKNKYVFKCTCFIGSQDKTAFPVWSSSYSNKFLNLTKIKYQ